MNLEDFIKKFFGFEPKDWLCGFRFKNNLYILSLSEYKKCYSHENAKVSDLIRLILHEFIHAIHMLRSQNCNYIWLGEGLATYLSGQYSDVSSINCTYQELLNGCSYANYRVMFEYVFNTYGKDYVLKLIDDEIFLSKETKRLYEEVEKRK